MAQATVREPDVFGKQLKHKKKGRFWKGLGLLCLLTIGAGALWGTFTPQGREMVPQVINAAQVGSTVYRNPEYIFDQVRDDHVNILLIGEDRNWTIKPVLNPRTGKYAPMNVIDTETPPRSDTMIIVSLDRSHNSMRMLSLPRDARVRFKDLEGNRHKAKLNAVYAAGGKDPMARREVLKKFLADEMGLRIDRVAVIDIDGFTKLIDKIGGVQINVDGALKRDSRTGKLYRGHIHRVDNWGQWSVDLDPGPQLLNGKQAQGYVRFRYDREGDPGRIRRQQQVMSALAKGIIHQPLLTLPGLAKEARQQFKADMDDTELASAAFFTNGLGNSVKIQPMTPYGIYADSDIILNKPDNVKLFGAIFGTSFTPSKFLVRSPSTERDDIGHTNNRNPAALAVLREAGLVKIGEDTATEANPVLDAPVRESDTGTKTEDEKIEDGKTEDGKTEGANPE